MANGDEGEAVAAARAVLIECGEMRSAERLVETNNVSGANIFGPRHSKVPGETDPQALFSRFSLNSDKTLDVPAVRAHSCQLIGPRDAKNWQMQGLSEAENEEITKDRKSVV